MGGTCLLPVSGPSTRADGYGDGRTYINDVRDFSPSLMQPYFIVCRFQFRVEASMITCAGGDPIGTVKLLA